MFGTKSVVNFGPLTT